MEYLLVARMPAGDFNRHRTSPRF